MGVATIIILAAAFCCQNISASPLCTDEDLKEKFPLHLDDFPNAVTEEELENMCKEYVPVANGIVDYIGQCSNTEMMKRLRFYEIIKENLNNLCTAGTDLNRKYLENAKCLKVDNKIGTTCISAVMPNDLDEGDPCSYGFLYNGCVYTEVLEKCGWDALYVAKEIGRSDLEAARRKCCE